MSDLNTSSLPIGFDLTPADFAEAQAVVQASQLAIASSERVIRALLVWAPMFGYGILFATYMGRRNDGYAGDTSIVAHYVLLPLLPWVLVIGSSLVLTYRQIRRTAARPPWESRAATVRSAKPARRWLKLLWTLGNMMLLIALAFLLESMDSQNQYTSQHSRDFNASLFGIGCIDCALAASVFGLWALTINRIRVGKGVWAQQLHLHKHFTLRFGEDGIDLEADHLKNHYAWPAFAGFLETPSLMILFLSPALFHMVPKRAFGNPADLDAFSALIGKAVASGHFLPRQGAFPVLPPVHV